MIIYDFFSGTGSATQAFKDKGHTVVTFELDPQFEATEIVNVLDLTALDLIAKYGKPDFVWASPPCTSFSVASIGRHWISGGSNPVPRTEQAKTAQELVAYTRSLIAALEPNLGFLIENPRGMLRKLSVLADLPRVTVTYCAYGEKRMKPTDLWGFVPNWEPKQPCKNGDFCHEAAPRGARTGTQGIEGAKNRSRVPYQLGCELLDALSKSLGQ